VKIDDDKISGKILQIWLNCVYIYIQLRRKRPEDGLGNTRNM